MILNSKYVLTHESRSFSRCDFSISAVNLTISYSVTKNTINNHMALSDNLQRDVQIKS